MSEKKTVRAKFRCESVTKSHTGNKDEAGNPVFNQKIQCYPVYGKDGTANAQWSKWTPSGSFEMVINNPGAQIFEPGTEYFLDITEAPPEQ